MNHWPLPNSPASSISSDATAGPQDTSVMTTLLRTPDNSFDEFFSFTICPPRQERVKDISDAFIGERKESFHTVETRHVAQFHAVQVAQSSCENILDETRAFCRKPQTLSGVQKYAGELARTSAVTMKSLMTELPRCLSRLVLCAESGPAKTAGCLLGCLAAEGMFSEWDAFAHAVKLLPSANVVADFERIVAMVEPTRPYLYPSSHARFWAELTMRTVSHATPEVRQFYISKIAPRWNREVPQRETLPTARTPLPSNASNHPNRQEGAKQRTFYIANVDVHYQRAFVELLNSCGPVSKVRLYARANTIARYSFVEMATDDGAHALLIRNGNTIGTWRLRIQPAKSSIKDMCQTDAVVSPGGEIVHPCDVAAVVRAHLTP